MKAAGVVLLVLGLVFLALAGINASKAPNISYLVGTFLPGLVCLILGLILGQTMKQQPGSHADEEGAQAAVADWDLCEHSSSADHARADAFKLSANLGIGCGIVLMFVGSTIAQGAEGKFLIGSLFVFAGFAWELWGCVNYMRWKGYSGWFGLFGYLLLPGLLILVCFPNRRKRALQKHSPDQIGEIEALLKEDRRPGYRFLLSLVPLGLLSITLGGLAFSIGSSIGAAEWKEVAAPEVGFHAFMPGTPRLEQNTQETPAGNVELHKFTVEPKGKRELFMIVSVRVPMDVSRELGGTERLLELGRQDLLSASQGQLLSERQIRLGSCPGLELEVLPPKGAIVKARIYATANQFYQVAVHVPRIRLASADVQKFFDSFRLSAEPGAAPDRGGM
jgi:hypothetical protein